MPERTRHDSFAQYRAATRGVRTFFVDLASLYSGPINSQQVFVDHRDLGGPSFPETYRPPQGLDEVLKLDAVRDAVIAHSGLRPGASNSELASLDKYGMDSVLANMGVVPEAQRLSVGRALLRKNISSIQDLADLPYDVRFLGRGQRGVYLEAMQSTAIRILAERDSSPGA